MKQAHLTPRQTTWLVTATPPKVMIFWRMTYHFGSATANWDYLRRTPVIIVAKVLQALCLYLQTTWSDSRACVNAWHADLAERIRSFQEKGGSVVFFPEYAVKTTTTTTTTCMCTLFANTTYLHHACPQKIEDGSFNHKVVLRSDDNLFAVCHEGQVVWFKACRKYTTFGWAVSIESADREFLMVHNIGVSEYVGVV